MPVRKNKFEPMPHADSLPNGGYNPLKKVNKRKRSNVVSKPSNNLQIRQTDFDTSKSNGNFHSGYNRPGSNKK